MSATNLGFCKIGKSSHSGIASGRKSANRHRPQDGTVKETLTKVVKKVVKQAVKEAVKG